MLSKSSLLLAIKNQLIIPISKYNIVKEKIKTKVSIILIKNKKITLPHCEIEL